MTVEKLIELLKKHATDGGAFKCIIAYIYTTGLPPPETGR
jgi:hypothetical protein